MKIEHYNTWKRRNNPEIWAVRDGIKGWAVQTVGPTIEHYGWKQCIMDADYGICDTIKPKQLAIKLLKEIWGEEWINTRKFVYYVYYGTNGYMDVIYVWCKNKDEKDIDYDYYENLYKTTNKEP